jgi:hypothetical protein
MPPISRSRRMPASPTVLKPLICEALNQGPLRRDALIKKLKELVPAAGFTFNETTQGVGAAKKALRGLRDEGRIFNPQPRWWQLRDAQTPAAAAVDEGDDDDDAMNQDAIDEHVTEEEMIDGIATDLKIERTIGDGPECVYIYYHDAYAELARCNGLTVWECKVGSTTGGPDARVIGQGALTCFPRPPMIGLVIRTHQGRSLERLLHSALTFAGKRIEDGGGAEWFRTSPDHVERWYAAFLQTISILGLEDTHAAAGQEQPVPAPDGALESAPGA